ncbi:MAG: hypothetical protein V1847_02035 [Candidatus Diapherotrites archaeon]
MDKKKILYSKQPSSKEDKKPQKASSLQKDQFIRFQTPKGTGSGKIIKLGKGSVTVRQIQFHPHNEGKLLALYPQTIRKPKVVRVYHRHILG